MSGGLIQLVAYGVQDIFLTKDPQITFFKVIYRRHTNFSTENVVQKFKTVPNFNTKSSTVLAKAGDLIRKMYLVIEFPHIPDFIEDGELSKKLKLAWVKKIGYAVIDYIEIEIGGQSINKHYGEWLYIWDELTGKHDRGADILIGNIKNVTDFTNKNDGFKVYVPLQFWFCRKAGVALPLVCLQYNEIKINLSLKSANNCHITAPKNYIKIYDNLALFKDFEYIEQEIDGIKATGKFIHYDNIEQKLYYNRISDNPFKSYDTGNVSITTDTALLNIQNDPEIYEPYSIRGLTSNYKAMPVFNTIEQNFRFPIINQLTIKECYMLVEYIYLDKDERIKFVDSRHEYLIDQVQFSGKHLIESLNNKINLGFSHPCKQIIWVCQYNYLLNTRNNDIFNYTDSYKHDENGNCIGNDIIKDASIIFNHHDRVGLRDIKYFNDIHHYTHGKYTPSTGINAYSFSLYPYEYQPSGSANLSKIDSFDLAFTVNKNSEAINNAIVKVYAVTYNVLRVANGLCGVVFDQ